MAEEKADYVNSQLKKVTLVASKYSWNKIQTPSHSLQDPAQSSPNLCTLAIQASFLFLQHITIDL